jgi:hypothetical protein
MATKKAIEQKSARVKPAAKNATANPSMQKVAPTPVSTQDRVAALLEVFNDVAAETNKSPRYQEEVLTASGLHWAVAIRSKVPHMALPEQEISKLKSIVEATITKYGSVDVFNAHNETPLHWALVNKRTDAVELLVENGADVNAMATGGTPLHYLTASGNSYSTKLILRAGADAAIANRQKKLPIVFIPAVMKKYFKIDVHEAKVHIIATGFELGKLPSLSRDEMKRAINAAIEHRTAYRIYESTPNYYLQSNGVQTEFGVPTCSSCNERFSNDTSYARHVLSLEHILKYHGTTYEGMCEASAYLTFRGEFSNVASGEKSVSDFLDQYPVADENDE